MTNRRAGLCREEGMTGLAAIRQAREDEAERLTDLALRSKAVWGYDREFMDMCVAELTVRAERIAANEFWVSDGPAGPTGLYELIVDADDLAPGVGELHLIFVEPETIGSGLGRRLWQHMEDRARARDIAVIGLDADPNALPFYERMGCRRVGQSPSGSVPGRMLPRLEKRLDGRPGSN